MQNHLLRSICLLILISGFMILPTALQARQIQIGPQCAQCTRFCFRVYQQCVIANSPCGPECQEQCHAEQAACQQANCVDTGICPNN